MTSTKTTAGPGRRLLLGAALALLAGCGPAPGSTRPELTIQLRTLNRSGVTGSVTFTDVRNGRTRVTVVVDQTGNPDMPAHIHPGSCDNLTPQPKYPLENVRDGKSTTEIPVSTAELLADQTAVNLHASVSDLTTYTACAEIR